MKSTLIAIALALIIAAAVGGYASGGRVAHLKNELHESEQTIEALQKLSNATDRIRELEHAGQLAIDSRTEQLRKEIKDAQRDRNRFIAGVRNGTIRLSIPVIARNRDPASANTAATARRGNETRAELDPTAAATLEAIVGDGDNRIRQLNACISSYNSIRDKYNVQAQ